MQVFKTFLKVLWKHLPVAFTYVVLFMLVGIAMTVMDDSHAAFEQTKLNICLFDEDDTPASRALCTLIGEKNCLVETENDTDKLLDALYYERVDYVLTIKSGYAEKLASGQTDALFESLHLHDSYSTVYMEQFLNEYAATVTAFLEGGDDLNSAVNRSATAFETENEVTTATFVSAHHSEVPESVSTYFRFLPYLILSVMMSVLCPVLLAMTKREIRYRTECSGIRLIRFQAELFAGSAVFVTGIWLLLMLPVLPNGGCILHGTAWLGVLNSFIFTMFAAAFTLLVAVFEPSQNIVSIITQIVTLGMCFLCGVFVDQSNMGEGVLAAARFLPAYWYMRVNRMLEGAEVFDAQLAAKSLLIEAAFVAVLTIVTVLIRKTRAGSLRRT